jgi:hypothetical protein
MHLNSRRSRACDSRLSGEPNIRGAVAIASRPRSIRARREVRRSSIRVYPLSEEDLLNAVGVLEVGLKVFVGRGAIHTRETVDSVAFRLNEHMMMPRVFADRDARCETPKSEATLGV